MAYTKNDVLEAVPFRSGSAVSLNVISQALGYAKSNAGVREVLYGLVKEGAVKASVSDRGFDVYYRVEGKTVSMEKEQATTTQVKKEVTFKEIDATKDYLPVNNYGYKFESTRVGFTITTPEGKTIELKASERFLVINNNADYRWIIEKPEDLFTAVAIYCKAQGITTYVIKNVETGKPVNEVKDLGDVNCIAIFLTIERYNKAGK